MVNAKEMWCITLDAVKEYGKTSEKRCEKIVKEMKKQAKQRNSCYYINKYRLSDDIVQILKEEGYEVKPYTADYMIISWKPRDDDNE